MPPAGAAFAELVELCPFLLDWKNSVYELLFDFVQPYRGRAHSTGIVGLRCRDVSVRNLGKAWNTAVLAVIPGPQAPKNLTPYFQLTRDALQKFASEGFPVTQLGQSFNTRGAIVTCQADGQARALWETHPFTTPSLRLHNDSLHFHDIPSLHIERHNSFCSEGPSLQSEAVLMKGFRYKVKGLHSRMKGTVHFIMKPFRFGKSGWWSLLR